MGMRTAVVLASFALCAAVPAQSTPVMSSVERSMWNAKFAQTLDGAPPGGGAVFASQTLNSTPGVFPAAGALMSFRSLVSSELSSATNCADGDIFEAIGSSPSLFAKFKEYVSTGTYKSELANVPLTLEHLNAIWSAGSGGYLLGGSVVVTGSALESEGLKLDSALGSPSAYPIASAPQIVKDFGETLLNVAVFIRDAGMERLPTAENMVSGIGPKAPNASFYSSVLTPTFGEVHPKALIVLFGDYGLVFATRVEYLGYTYLVDGHKGAVYGPYDAAQPLSAKELLSAYDNIYTSDMTVQIVSVGSCSPMAVSWPRNPGMPAPAPCPCAPAPFDPALPPAGYPLCCIPAPVAPPPGAPAPPAWAPGPWTPVIPNPGTPLPGTWWPAGGWSCNSTGIGVVTCTCTRTMTYTRCTRSWPLIGCVSTQTAVVTETCTNTTIGAPGCGGTAPTVPAYSCTSDYQVFP